MLSTPLSAALGLAFVLIGLAALWLIFEASRHSHNQVTRNRRIQAHRVARYLFHCSVLLHDVAYAAETQGRVR